MKNRRNIIVAFLLCACLFVGIGYAQVTGQLAIAGNARFNGAEKLSNDVTSAVKFTSAVAGKNCDSATISSEDNGYMVVVINDAVGTAGATFDAIATFTIGYDTTDSTFPEVLFAVPTPDMRPVAGTELRDNWDIEAVYTNASNGATINTDGTVKLAPGATVDVVVTITFTNGTGEEGNEVFKGADTAAISIGLPYATIAEN